MNADLHLIAVMISSLAPEPSSPHCSVRARELCRKPRDMRISVLPPLTLSPCWKYGACSTNIPWLHSHGQSLISSELAEVSGAFGFQNKWKPQLVKT